jgi:hypothetical protein
MDLFVQQLIDATNTIEFPAPDALAALPSEQTLTTARFFKRTVTDEALDAVVKYKHYVAVPYPFSASFDNLTNASLVACFRVMPDGWTDMTIDLRFVCVVNLLDSNNLPAELTGIACDSVLSINRPAALLIAGGPIRTAIFNHIEAANAAPAQGKTRRVPHRSPLNTHTLCHRFFITPLF